MSIFDLFRKDNENTTLERGPLQAKKAEIEIIHEKFLEELVANIGEFVPNDNFTSHTHIKGTFRGVIVDIFFANGTNPIVAIDGIGSYYSKQGVVIANTVLSWEEEKRLHHAQQIFEGIKK